MIPIAKWRVALLPLAAACALLVGAVAAQTPVPPTAPPPPTEAIVLAPPQDPPLPLLWKVSDADNAVYLLGSFHLLKPDDYPLSADVNRAFADAKALVFELGPDEMSSPQLGLRMAQAAMRLDGKTLDSDLSPQLRDKLKGWADANQGALEQIGMPAQALQRFEPWYAGLLITLIEMNKYGLDAKLGLDQHFIAAAAAAKKPASGLETADEQIAFLDGMSREEQLQFLDEAITEAGEGNQQIEQMHSAWRTADEARLWNEMAGEMKRDYPRLYQRINVERNDAWVPKIESLLSAPGTDDKMVVVGTLHLLGEDGIVEKLRAKGYTVERICSACKLAEEPAHRKKPRAQ
ncbi:TraB/GumN family protein [Luteimonas aquatica]|uniref:TraB/GumN family protein n=1 Tax=Luteimonas aquatica TaxID=450364 RepID=UPI001F585DDF|nr:TraB/GumN family protein [Luteimonas aquatica]